MDIISTALELVPVPGLSTAFRVLQYIWNSVKQVSQGHAQLEQLVVSASELLVVLNGKLRAAPNTVTSMKEGLDMLQTLLDEIREFVEIQQNKSFLKSFFQIDEIQTQIAAFNSRLLHCCNTFVISTQIDQVKWQKNFASALQQDQEVMAHLLDELMTNQDALFKKLFGKLEVQQTALESAMTAMLKILGNIGDANNHVHEREFLQHAIALMQRRSSTHVKVESWTISIVEIEKNRMIDDSGGFSKVFKGTFLGAPVAIKELHCSASKSLIKNEIKVWRQLRHPCVIQFLGAGVNEVPPFLVMPLMPNGNACNFTARNPGADQVLLVHQISLGLVYLHARNVIHGDLKAANVLINASGCAVLSDFGLSAIKTDISSRSAAVLITGTKRWMSPERMNGKRLHPSMDIYSWAMTAYEIFTGLVPFNDTDESLLYDLVVRENIRPDRPDGDIFSNQLWSLLVDSWVANHLKRPNASDLRDRTAILKKPQGSGAFSIRERVGTIVRSLSSHDVKGHPSASTPPTPSMWQSWKEKRLKQERESEARKIRERKRKEYEHAKKIEERALEEARRTQEMWDLEQMQRERKAAQEMMQRERKAAQEQMEQKRRQRQQNREERQSWERGKHRQLQHRHREIVQQRHGRAQEYRQESSPWSWDIDEELRDVNFNSGDDNDDGLYDRDLDGDLDSMDRF